VFIDFQHYCGPRLSVGADGTLTEISRLKCALYSANPAKISMLKWEYHCIHSNSETKIFNTSKPRYHEETKYFWMISITHHSKSKKILCIPCPTRPQPSPRYRGLCCSPARLEMLQEKNKNWKRIKKRIFYKKN
jgi:hypothetical protein